MDPFQRLIVEINNILGPTGGIDSSEVEVNLLKNAMVKYDSNEIDWKKYALGDANRHYTRNLVDHGNGKTNLLVLVWTPGQGSPVHDHANAHCVMKVLKGNLAETIYSWPCERDVEAALCHGMDEKSKPEHICSASNNFTATALREKRTTTYSRDQVTYMSDKLGLHRICNPSQTDVAVSLHLYTVRPFRVLR